ncbi:hypothetical protein PHLCEN_2v10827 [Hermanssonia centrifuga]|uniref:Phosphomethylpyrimidine kinase n=1 Tax=Hermanssonia centrifuga TaxID=98765 RepID=A0A2R6NLM2_9APHY|nr:hypothetical protein PHLCEN_2v10827 [Hermanssonia centrifuga]
MLVAAKNLLKLGPRAVLLKGGHLTATLQDVERAKAYFPKIRIVSDGLYAENMEILQVTTNDSAAHPRLLVVDVLEDSSGTVLYLHPRIESTSTHGTGCTLSAAIVCCLSRGQPCFLLAVKSTEFPAIKAATDTIINVVNEVATHTAFLAEWGVTEEELLSTPESSATTAYGAYLLDCGLQGDRSKLVMAVAACLLGYGEVGLWLKKEASKPSTWVVTEGNPYARWMDDYGGEHYQNAVKIGIQTIEAMAAADPPSPARYAEWSSVWERCTRLEKNFWDMAMGLL